MLSLLHFQNHGNYIISLGNLARWLGEQAEALGVVAVAAGILRFSGVAVAPPARVCDIAMR